MCSFQILDAGAALRALEVEAGLALLAPVMLLVALVILLFFWQVKPWLFSIHDENAEPRAVTARFITTNEVNGVASK